MLNKLQAEEIINKYVDLRDQVKASKVQTREFIAQKNLCIEKFGYIIQTRIARYRNFSNYDDLKQEGLIGLLFALDNFDPSKKAPFFYWAHQYIDTRIARAANCHSTIKFPMHLAKGISPFKEDKMPNIMDTKTDPEISYQKKELNNLSENERKILSMLYGIDNKKMNIDQISKEIGLELDVCKKYMRTGIAKMKAKLK